MWISRRSSTVSDFSRMTYIVSSRKLVLTTVQTTRINSNLEQKSLVTTFFDEVKLDFVSVISSSLQAIRKGMIFSYFYSWSYPVLKELWSYKVTPNYHPTKHLLNTMYGYKQQLIYLVNRVTTFASPPRFLDILHYQSINIFTFDMSSKLGLLRIKKNILEVQMLEETKLRVYGQFSIITH